VRTYDTIIIGGGPAGLSAALVLGRSRRSVLVIDAGRPRNYASHAMHNFPTRDGIHPQRWLDLARRDLSRYAVEFRSGVVTAANCRPGGFDVRMGRTLLRSRTLLLATGVIDELPDIPGLTNFYGVGVHHCPYCDGWEYSDQPIAAFGHERKGLGLALNLQTWSKNLTIITNGERLPPSARRDAERFNIRIRTEKIAALYSRRNQSCGALKDPLARIAFESGDDLPVRAIFFNTEKYQRSSLPSGLGCQINDVGGVIHDKRQRTGVSGLYLAGDASFDVQFVIVAAAEGAKAGVAINSDLQILDREITCPSRDASTAPRPRPRKSSSRSA
jgi:thioredoxin reductase